jgi:hypothetical protein
MPLIKLLLNKIRRESDISFYFKLPNAMFWSILFSSWLSLFENYWHLSMALVFLMKNIEICYVIAFYLVSSKVAAVNFMISEAKIWVHNFIFPDFSIEWWPQSIKWLPGKLFQAILIFIHVFLEIISNISSSFSSILIIFSFWSLPSSLFLRTWTF